MIIGKYIKKLLEERKRVILPGFGNLEVKEASPGDPTPGGRIDPPGLSIRFDAGYSKDDGLLAATYAAGENIDEEKAQQRVLELVDSIKFALDKGEPFLLPETGKFSRDDDGKVRVQPDPGWVLEPDQYGLESVELLELDEEHPPKETAPEKPEAVESIPEPSTKPAPAETAAIPPKPTKEPKAQQPVPPSRSPVKKAPPVTPLYTPAKSKATSRSTRWRVIWIIAGSLIVILIALILIPVDWNQFQNQERGNEGNEPVRVENGKVPGGDKESVKETAGGNETSGQQQKEGEVTGETSSSSEGKIDRAGDEEHNFFIIVGSFKNLRNASDLQDQLKARGYAAEIMITENRMYRVSVLSFATKPEAERALAGVKSDPGLEASWLLSN